MSTELIINASLPETRISMMESGEIQELLIERASGKGIVGNIYKGRVTRVLPGMQAAFVDIGLEKAAFLYVDDVYVHSEIWEAEEEAPAGTREIHASVDGGEEGEASHATEATPSGEGAQVAGAGESSAPTVAPEESLGPSHLDVEGADLSAGHGQFDEESEFMEDLHEDLEHDLDSDEEEGDDEDGDEPAEMSAEGEGEGSNPEGTISASPGSDSSGGQGAEGQSQGAGGGEGQGGDGGGRDGSRRRHRRGRRGGKFRRKERDERGPREGGVSASSATEGSEAADSGDLPENFEDQVAESGSLQSDRSALGAEMAGGAGGDTDRPESGQEAAGDASDRRQTGGQGGAGRQEFRENRSRDKRIRTKQSARPIRAQVNIQDLLKEGQEVIVQVAKDPIATKGARLTCHISLPGRHLVCMPTIDHVGVSRRIDRDDERRKLREHVERYRPKNLGFIVRTASGKGQSEKRIKQDIEYLSRLWNEIREKASSVTAPALVYEDLNSVLRAIRDWVTEDIDKIVVDSRYHYNEIQKFVSHFMPSLKQKVELYHGDIPIFDAYGISTELSRALERKVWLKSGGYIVVDQAEALVAIDVNTGRYVGKKNLEDTILKTNLEAVQEIAYQLRLRNCGGIIILDLIDMEKEENKHRVYRALEEALKKDRARPSILKISELGLIEMTRKRTRDTMVRALCESCSHCEGKGFIKSKQTVAYEALREMEREGIEKDVTKILVQAHPDVIDLLAIDERETLDQLERRYRKQVFLQAVMDFHPEQYEVSGDKKEGAQARNPLERLNSRGRDHDRGSRQDRDRGGQKSQGGGGGRDQQRSSGGSGGSSGGGEVQRSSGDRGGDRDRGGRDRNRDRDRGRGRDRDRGQRDRGGVPQIRPNVGPIAPEGVQSVGPIAVAHTEGDDADSQARFLNVIEKRGYANPTAQQDAGAPQPDLAPPQGDFYDEEDRLAFQRAQAAQDAALARLQGADGNSQQRPNKGGRDKNQGSGGGVGGRNHHNKHGRRGRRGGGERDRFGGGQQRFSRPSNGPGNGAPNGPGTGPGNDSHGQSQSQGGGESSQRNSGGESSGDGGGSGGSSSGHSQPPV